MGQNFPSPCTGVQWREASDVISLGCNPNPSPSTCTAPAFNARAFYQPCSALEL